MENFIFAKLSSKHKKWFVIHQLSIFSLIGSLSFLGIKMTNPEIITTNDKMSLTFGAIIGIGVGIMAYSNRLKSLIKIKFIGLGILWILLVSLQMIIPTVITTLGLIIPVLMVDDLIINPIWKNIWYNNYE